MVKGIKSTKEAIVCVNFSKTWQLICDWPWSISEELIQQPNYQFGLLYFQNNPYQH